MPELPEVETVKRGLDQLIVGKIVADVTSDWVKSFPNAQTDVNQFLMGATVQKLRRRGKALIIDLNSKYSLVIHLKMTGQLVFVGQQKNEQKAKSKKQKEVRFGAGHPTDSLVGELPDKSTRVTFTFKDKSRLFFNDQRKFGWVRLLPTIEIENLDFMKKLGPEPLENDFTNTKFVQRLQRRKNSGIKAVLLDQTVVAGVGNIYADESLYAAKIHPATLVKDVPRNELKVLFKELIKVLRRAIESGGSTDKNYVDAEGKKGSYLTFARVFRREGKACERCGDIIIKTKVAGRGTHTCPTCQRSHS
ncbi:MAG: DNA-formamidopyrimidine glycosylase [Candidatus Saccharibacteria bacterium]|nr:DNA-formamidopyrimidine glycosylase [Candidatus Saccharibacteria bacterium]